MPLERPDEVSPDQPGTWLEQATLTADKANDKTWNALEDTLPPIVMIGCHRNSEDAMFRDFSLPNAQFDELSIWTKALKANRSTNELLYLTGGYGESIHNMLGLAIELR